MSNLLKSVVACFLGLMILVPLAARSQETPEANPCAPPTYRTDVRPDPKGTPTEITLGMVIADLLEINDVNQTITLDLAARMRWVDPRLANWAGCRLSIEHIWFPELIMKNSGRVFSRWPETVSIEKGGQVTYLQRFSGSFTSYHKLAEFPFDKQVISLRFFPLDWSAEKLVFREDPVFFGASPLLNISDWKITSVRSTLSQEEKQEFMQVRSVYELKISAERYVGYYIWKIMLPIALIVVMSWCVFWIDPGQFGTQIGLSATSVLTMIAFIFATTNMLPRLGYFTMLDSYVLGATVFVFVALLESLVTGYLTTRGRKVLANRIDHFSRFAFPLVFALLVSTFFMDAS